MRISDAEIAVHCMTRAEFRNDPERVSGARHLMDLAVFQDMLEVMRSLHPVNRAAPSDVSPHGAHILLGEQTGWQQYESEFLKLGSRIEANPNAAPVEDYASEPEEEQPQ